MWKVLLADDEEVIVNGLKKLIDWNSLDLEIVGVATDGQQAVDMIRALHPDIVITDVKMPIKNGTDVIEEIGQEDIKPEFIFVSAYQEFDYIKTAMSKGAVDYLLKPVRKKDLEEVLKKTIEQLENQSAINLFKQNPEETRMLEMIQNLNEGYEYVKSDIYDAIVKMNIDVTDRFYVGICAGIVPEGRASRIPFEKYQLMRFVIYNRITDYLRDHKQGFPVRKDDNCCNLIAVIEDDREETFVEEVFRPLLEDLEREYQVRICIGIGERTKELEKMNVCYTSARYAFELYYFEEMELIDVTKLNTTQTESDGSIEEFNRLCDEVFSGIASKNDALEKNIRDVLMEIRRMHYGNRYAAVNLCLSFSGNLHERLHKYDMVESSFAEHQETMLKEMRACTTYREMIDFLLDYYQDIMPQIYEKVQNKDVAVILDIKKYLQENYMKDISLKELADMVCVSPSYFSTFFKNTTGENYKSYLIKIRLEEAIKLVMNTDLKTYQVAERVGYNNVRRFVDAFKNRYGMSPMEYRKLYRKKEN